MPWEHQTLKSQLLVDKVECLTQERVNLLHQIETLTDDRDYWKRRYYDLLNEVA